MFAVGGFTPYGGAFPMGGPANPFQAGFQQGLQAARMRDGFMGSPGLMDGRFGPLGGLGGGFGNPMMGMGGLGQAGPQQLMQILRQLLGALMQQTGQGMGGPGCGGPFGGGFPGGPGGPGGCPGGPGGFPGGPGGFPGGPGFPMGGPMGGPMGPGGPGAIGGPRQGGARTIELQVGQSFTTPGGCTIQWNKKNDEVKVSEPGGGNQSHSCGGAGAANGRNFGASLAMSAAGRVGEQSFAMAFSATMGGGGGPAGAVAAQQGKQNAPRNWRVWGDPHIDHPNGKKSDFTKKNAMFTLSDGSKVIMCANNPKGVVNRVQIVLPGGQPNWNGIDKKQTSVMQDQGGMFKPIGTADQFQGGGFGMPGGGGFHF